MADGSVHTRCAPPADAPWLLLLSKPRAETIARLHLQRQGFEVFLPRIARESPGPAGMRRCIEALFPRYLFIRGDSASAAWSAIRSTRGVSGLVRFGEQLARVPSAVMAAMLSCHDASLDLLNPLPKALRPGQRVRVNDGPLSGLSGIYLAPCGTTRVQLLLQLVGAQRQVDVAATSVLPIA